MTNSRHLVSTAFGLSSALSFAVGIAFLVMWAFDGASAEASMPELVAGLAAISAAVLSLAARRIVIKRENATPAE